MKLETVAGIAMAVTNKKGSSNKVEQRPASEQDEGASMASSKASKISSDIFGHSFHSSENSTVMTDSRVSFSNTWSQRKVATA